MARGEDRAGIARSRRCGSGRQRLSCRTMFGMGIGELLVVVVVVLLVFGPGRLPDVMGSLGRGMQEFKKGLREPPEIEKAPENDDPAAKARRED